MGGTGRVEALGFHIFYHADNLQPRRARLQGPELDATSERAFAGPIARGQSLVDQSHSLPMNIVRRVEEATRSGRRPQRSEKFGADGVSVRHRRALRFLVAALNRERETIARRTQLGGIAAVGGGDFDARERGHAPHDFAQECGALLGRAVRVRHWYRRARSASVLATAEGNP